MSKDYKNLRNINHVMLRNGEMRVLEPPTPKYTSADTDDKLIRLWLYGKSKNTQEYYQADAKRFLDFIKKSLREVTLDDLHKFAQEIDKGELADSSKRRVLSSIKSLFAFGAKVGYLRYDVSQMLKLEKVPDCLTERILSQEEIRKIIESENKPRNRLMLEMLFITGVRVSELSNLQWKDLHKRDGGGQMTVCGKGKKTRTLLIPASVWDKLIAFKNGNICEGYIFKSKNATSGLHRGNILRIVRKAVEKAGIDKPVSPHWFRHSHATIAAEKAPLHVVQHSLGHSSIQTTGKYLHVKPTDCSSNYINI